MTSYSSYLNSQKKIYLSYRKQNNTKLNYKPINCKLDSYNRLD